MRKTDLTPRDAQGNKVSAAGIKLGDSVFVTIDDKLTKMYVKSTNPWAMVDNDASPRDATSVALTPAQVAALKSGDAFYVIFGGVLVQKTMP